LAEVQIYVYGIKYALLCKIVNIFYCFRSP